MGQDDDQAAESFRKHAIACIHKSYIISLQHIAEVNRSRIILDNGDDVPIGDLYRDRLNEYIQQKFLGK